MQARAAHKAKSFGLTLKADFAAKHPVNAKKAEARTAFFARKAEEVAARVWRPPRRASGDHGSPRGRGPALTAAARRPASASVANMR